MLDGGDTHMYTWEQIDDGVTTNVLILDLQKRLELLGVLDLQMLHLTDTCQYYRE